MFTLSHKLILLHYATSMLLFFFATANSKLYSIFLYKCWYALIFLLVHIYLWKWGKKERMQYDEFLFSEKDDGEISLTLVAAEFSDTPLPLHVFAEYLKIDWNLSFMEGRVTVLKWVYNVFFILHLRYLLCVRVGSTVLARS